MERANPLHNHTCSSAPPAIRDISWACQARTLHLWAKAWSGQVKGKDFLFVSAVYLGDLLGPRQAQEAGSKCIIHIWYQAPLRETQRVKCTISFCFKAYSVTLAKLALLSYNLTLFLNYYYYYCQIYLYKLLIMTYSSIWHFNG